MQPDTHAINLLRARASTIEEVLNEFQRRFKASPVTNPDAQYLSREQEFATRLADMKREAIVSIKKIEARKG